MPTANEPARKAIERHAWRQDLAPNQNRACGGNRCPGRTADGQTDAAHESADPAEYLLTSSARSGNDHRAARRVLEELGKTPWQPERKSPKPLTPALPRHAPLAPGAARGREFTVAALYEPRRKRLQIELASGIAVVVPVAKVQGLAKVAPAAVKTVELTGNGYGLYWPKLDLDVSLPDLVAGCFGPKTWMSTLARHAGRTTSPAKARSSRENGKKGGRPRKAPTPVLAV